MGLFNLASFFEKTLPEWTRRLRAAAGARSGLSIELRTEIGAVRLKWSGEQMTLEDGTGAGGLVEMPQARLIQMVMGYYGADAVVTFPDVRVTGESTMLSRLSW